MTTYCNTLKLPNLMYRNTLSNQLGHTERVLVPCVFRKQSGVLYSYFFIPISHKKSFTKMVTAPHAKCIRDFFRCISIVYRNKINNNKYRIFLSDFLCFQIYFLYFCPEFFKCSSHSFMKLLFNVWNDGFSIESNLNSVCFLKCDSFCS